MERLAHYTLLEKIGEGGMGEVFRAQDTRLKRDVAIKVLPEVFVQDPERLARFEREARVLASLQHPNVASIFGLEQDGGKRFLALELVAGEDLGKRLQRGPIPVEDAISIARQIASAVEAAHELGVVHRDLKPSNVMLTPEGEVKVLDFGLAKAAEGDFSDSSLDWSRSPTLTGLMTGANVILGTAAYMSPEQARGKRVDKRADIWSFGVIFYEMLTGNRLFEGETVSDTLASVLKSDPDWGRLPANTPLPVRSLLERCLDRDPRTRLRDIGEARILLAPDHAATPGLAPRAPGMRRSLVVAIALASLAVGAAVGLLIEQRTSGPAAGSARMMSLEPGPGEAPPSDPTISPDGTQVAYVRERSIWVRDLARLEPRHLERTEDVIDLFWSPDGDRIGYLTTDQVMTVDPVDGVPVVVASTGFHLSEDSGAGGFWSREQGILFARGQDDVFRVSPRGGDPTVYAPADTSREGDLHEPSMLPDGGLLVVPHQPGEAGLSMVEILYGTDRVEVTRTPGVRLYRPIWSPTGHILYERRVGNPGVWGVSWDVSGRRATGEPFLVFPYGSFPSVASDGTLVLLQGMASGRAQIVEADRTGKILRRIGDPRRYDFQLGLSPDGSRLAVIRSEEGTKDIWIHDLARGTDSRLTFFPGDKTHPQWSPDGRYLSYYVGNSLATLYAVVQPTDGSAGVDTLAARAAGSSFVPGTKDMVFAINTGETEWDLFVGPAVRGDARRPLVKEPSWQYAGEVSPDRKYLAYVSRETGVDQVFLKRFPDGSGKWQVSIEGGQWPQWNAAGNRLVYARGDNLVQVAVATSDPPVLGRPELLFKRESLGYQIRFGWQPHFAMTGDGERFYFFQSAEQGDIRTTMVLYENWTRAFEKP